MITSESNARLVRPVSTRSLSGGDFRDTSSRPDRSHTFEALTWLSKTKVCKGLTAT